MGIPSYFSYIIKNYSNIIRSLKDVLNQDIHHLFMDCNSIVYDAFRGIEDAENMNIYQLEELLIELVLNKIEEYLILIKPKKTAYIAFDGVAPLAKMEQQRSRRYKNSGGKTSGWSTSNITPGTEFMKKLSKKLNKKFEIYKNEAIQAKIIVSTSEEPGEGEHKLFQYIRDFPEKHIDKNTVIYGLDADLIMLSINHLPITNQIYLFRETPHFIQSISNDLEPNATYLLDIPELAKIITLNMNNGLELTTMQQKNRVYDYIFICFFLGNDFMPHFPSINIRTGGIDKMINAYKATIGSTDENLTDGKKIYWKNVRKLVQYLSELEHDNIKQEMKSRDRKEKMYIPNETPEDKLKKFESIPIYERQTEKYINPFKSGWEERYYKCLFDMEITEERKKQICVNYLEGLEWTMKYYTSGCSDWRWCYKYNYPPLLKDLIHYVPYFDTEYIGKNSSTPVSPLVQLCYVLPRQSLTLLPNKLYNALITEHNEWYNANCDFVWAYCKYFWESHVELPEIDIQELEHFVNNSK